jgi:hypothetical protein
MHTGLARVIRHGLSFARRSATRSPKPFHNRAEPVTMHRSPATLMGFMVPFAVFPGFTDHRISAVHPHLPFRASDVAYGPR